MSKEFGMKIRSPFAVFTEVWINEICWILPWVLFTLILSPFLRSPLLIIDKPAMKFGIKSLIPRKMARIIKINTAAVIMFNTIVVMPTWFRAMTIKMK